MKTDSAFETLKEWVNAANPGFVTHDDLARVEAKLDDLLVLVDDLEAKLAKPKRSKAAKDQETP